MQDSVDPKALRKLAAGAPSKRVTRVTACRPNKRLAWAPPLGTQVISWRGCR